MPSPRERVPELTLRALGAGVLLGILFGAANAYLGLRVGMTVSASIPAAVMSVALFRLFGAKGTILEANLAQTVGSASTALATGTIFTIPALFLWNLPPRYLQVVALAFLGGLLGIAAMIPLRRLLIVEARANDRGVRCASTGALPAVTHRSAGAPNAVAVDSRRVRPCARTRTCPPRASVSRS